MEEKQSYKLGNVFIESKPVSLANLHKDSEEHKTLKIQEFRFINGVEINVPNAKVLTIHFIESWN